MILSKNSFCLSLLLFFCLNFAYAQRPIFINYTVDTTDALANKALHFYINYLNDFKDDTLPEMSKYWSAEDCKRYKIPDQMIYSLVGDYPTYNLSRNRSIIYIRPDSNVIQLKTHFYDVDTSGEIYTVCITNHYVKVESENNIYFINPLAVNGRFWQTEKRENITFFFPAYHHFNASKADSLIQQIQHLEKDWALKPINIRYYFANTNEELHKLKGFDYSLMMGNRDKPSGIADNKDNIVYCGGLGENYFHEVVHIYLNSLFPKSPLGEGIAVFYGGSMGKSLSWHSARLKAYLLNHPETNLNKLEEFRFMDSSTNPYYTILGLLCETAYRKDGVKGLKRMMNYDSLDTLFEKEFGIKPEQKNDFLRNLINTF